MSLHLLAFSTLSSRLCAVAKGVNTNQDTVRFPVSQNIPKHHIKQSYINPLPVRELASAQCFSAYACTQQVKVKGMQSYSLVLMIDIQDYCGYPVL